ncbi:hypothetical protein HZB01_00565 [Candidatus Woesearchaeota archaeon]|nr:hypothetical protein [Candidatus Woesearchaeota archaeon]
MVEIIDKPLYVTVDIGIVNEDVEENLLVKRVAKQYMGGTFQELLNYMMDPSPDDVNEAGYGAAELQVVRTIGGWYDQALASPSTLRVQLYAKTNDDSREELSLDLAGRVADYAPQTLTVQEHTNDQGQNIPYHHLDLQLRLVGVGGNQSSTLEMML